MQIGFDDYEYWGGNRNNENAEQQIECLLNEWRKRDMPVIHVKHNATELDSPLRPEEKGNQLKEPFRPLNDHSKGRTEFVFEKTVNSAFIGTQLELHLRSNKIKSLVLTGLTSNHCVNTTARMAGNLGFETYLVSDATATFDRIGVDGEVYSSSLVHRVCLASLHREFCTVLKTKQVLQML